MIIEKGRTTERTRRDKALAFYNLPALSYPVLWRSLQNAGQVVVRVTELIPTEKAQAVETAKGCCRALYKEGRITQAEEYRVMSQICERYAQSMTMFTNASECDRAEIDRYEELARGFWELANEALENEAPE